MCIRDSRKTEVCGRPETAIQCKARLHSCCYSFFWLYEVVHRVQWHTCGCCLRNSRMTYWCNRFFWTKTCRSSLTRSRTVITMNSIYWHEYVENIYMLVKSSFKFIYLREGNTVLAFWVCSGDVLLLIDCFRFSLLQYSADVYVGQK